MTRFRLTGSAPPDRPSVALTHAPAAAYVEAAVLRSERRELLERAAKLSPRYPAAHRDHGVTGRNA